MRKLIYHIRFMIRRYFLRHRLRKAVDEILNVSDDILIEAEMYHDPDIEAEMHHVHDIDDMW